MPFLFDDEIDKVRVAALVAAMTVDSAAKKRKESGCSLPEPFARLRTVAELSQRTTRRTGVSGRFARARARRTR